MTDEEEPIDWDAARKAVLNMAELVWSYHQALISAGFSAEEAFALSVAYQTSFITTATSK